MQKDIKVIAKGAGINLFGEITGAIFAFGFNFILARYLSVEYVGLFFLGMSINRFIIDIIVCGFGYGIVRYVSIFHQEKDVKRMNGTILSALTIVIPLSIVVPIILYFMADTLSIRAFHNPELSFVIKIMAIATPFAAILEILLSSTQALKIMQDKVYVKRLIIPITQIIIFAILIYFGMQLTSALIAYTASLVLGAVISFYYFKNKFSIFDRNTVAIYNYRELVSFSATRLFSQLLIFFIAWTDTFMIGYFMTSKDVGVYNIVGRLWLFGAFISYSLATIFAPIVSSLYHKGDITSLKKYYAIVTKWGFTLSFPYFLLLILLPEYALNIFGKEYVEGVSCLLVLCYARIFASLTGPCTAIINMIGKPMLNLYNDLSTFILNIILNLFLIPQYGILGAAIATALSVTILNIIRIFEVYSILRVHPFNLSYLKPALSALIMIISIILSQRFVFPNCSIPFIISIIFVFLGLYFCLLKLLGLNEEDNIVLDSIGKKLFYRSVPR